MKKKLFTLCIIQKDSQILLGMKKRGFGQGRWNGFGGKVFPEESIEEAAKRELKEEIGISVQNVEKKGILSFEFEGNPEVLEVHIFSIPDFEGKPVETEEMKPRWFKNKEIPYERMWPDDKIWLPILLNNKKFRGNFYFRDNNTILYHSIKEVLKL
jgi:8-oxo-dGTP diphosphatase/2-hydroxy-dATP diphosphatase